MHPQVQVGIITRKDLDHAAGHGWWRMSHMAEPPQNKFLRHLRGIPSVGFLARLIGGGSSSAAVNTNEGGAVAGTTTNGGAYGRPG